MTYVITDACKWCPSTDCVPVCPVQCFYEGAESLAINPDECIDCGVCEPECPYGAIVPDTELKDTERWVIERNRENANVWPNITAAANKLPENALSLGPELRARAMGSFALSDEEIIVGLRDESPLIRYSLANNRKIKFSDDQIAFGIEDQDERVAAEFVRLARQLTPQQITFTLKHPSPLVRLALANKGRIQLTQQQLSDGIRDKESAVAQAFIRRWEAPALLVDDLRYLVDSAPDEVIEAFLYRYRKPIPDDTVMFMLRHRSPSLICSIVCHSGTKLSAEAIDVALKNKSDKVRAAVFILPYFKPTPAWIEKGLQDPSPAVRQSLARRKDISFSTDQIMKGLADESEAVRVSFVANRVVPIREFIDLVLAKVSVLS